MATIICNACSVINDCNSTKCESCTSILSDENAFAVCEWENDFRFIEEAESKGEIYNLESIDGALAKVELCEGIEQCIKEEPEVQLEPDIVNQSYVETGNEFKREQTDSDGYKHRCSQCTKCFKRKASLKAHLNAAHCESDSDSDRPIIKKIKSQQLSPKPKITVYKCKSCSKITKDYKEHVHHMKSHVNQRTSLSSGFLKCTICQKLFSNNFDFKIHKAQHEGQKVYQCDVCNAFLSNENVLEKHKNKLHSDTTHSSGAAAENKFRCEFCGKRFPLQILMVNHKKTHAEDAQLLEDTATISKEGSRISYICKICGKSSGNKSRHTEHLRVHTKNKPFQCDMCGAAFTARGSLTHHLRLHSDDRPFKCNICDVTYRHKKNLRRHLLKHTGERPHKCLYCDKRFSLKSTKIDHERQLHTGETPYQCEICELWFTTFALRNVHRRLKHDIDTNSKPRVEILINKITTSAGELSDQKKK